MPLLFQVRVGTLRARARCCCCQCQIKVEPRKVLAAGTGEGYGQSLEMVTQDHSTVVRKGAEKASWAVATGEAWRRALDPIAGGERDKSSCLSGFCSVWLGGRGWGGKRIGKGDEGRGFYLEQLQ